MTDALAEGSAGSDGWRRPEVGGRRVALLRRDRELGHLRRALGAASTGTSSALVLSGEAGSGKSALLDALVAEAVGPVLRVSGADVDAARAYGAMAELLVPLRGRASALSAGEALAIKAALGWGAPTPVDRLTVATAVLSLLRMAAAGGPLLVVVDGADAIDKASLEVLALVAGRLGSEGVVMIVGVRSEAALPSELDQLDRVRLDGLDPAAARRLLSHHAGSTIADPVRDRLVEAARGNPLALEDFTRLLTPGQLAGVEPLPVPLPVGERLQDAFADELAALPRATRRALVVVSAGSTSPRIVVAALRLAGIDPADLEPARFAGMVAVESQAITFRHPLVRATAYQGAPEVERSAAHLVLASANAEAGAVEAQAAHLALAATEPDEAVATVIGQAAALARDRGAVVEAADRYEHAARLSVDPARRAERMLAAAEACLLAGRTVRAHELTERVMSEPASDEVRARAALLHGRARLAGGDEGGGRRFLEAQARGVAANHPTLAAAMLAHASAAALRVGQVAAALDASRAASELVVDGGSSVEALVAVARGAALVASGRRDASDPLSDAAERLLSGTILPTEAPLVALTAALTLVWVEDNQRGRRLLEHLERVARSAGAQGLLAPVLVVRALLEYRTGDFPAAVASGNEARELAGEVGQGVVVSMASAVLGKVEAVQGRTESCRARCLALLDGPEGASRIARSVALSALGLLELGEGRAEEAARWLEILAGAGPRPSRLDPAVTMWESDLAEAYIRLGEVEKARSVVEDLDREACASASQRAQAAVARCRAMLAADDEEAEALFTAALRHLGGPERRFDRARTELVRGERLRRAGRVADARRRLANAQALFAQLGAGGWARRARGELDRLGGPEATGPDGVDGLFREELQVATAAALGGSVPEIAAAMFMSEPVVAQHLETAMQKLGVESSVELNGLVGRLTRAGTAPRPRVKAAPSRPDAFAPVPTGGGAAQIRLLGGFEIAMGGRSVPVPHAVTAQAVKRVALAGRLPAEELTELMWPEVSPGAGRTRLRSLLARLRQVSGPVLVREGPWVALPEGTDVDVQRFEESAMAAQAAASAGEPRAGTLARDALALYSGELLPTDRHLDFTAGPRERLRRRYLAVLSVAVDDAASKGQVDLAVRLLDDAITTDPHDEALYLRAATLLQGSGRSTQARVVLQRARAMLAELGLPASDDLKELERVLRLTD